MVLNRVVWVILCNLIERAGAVTCQGLPSKIDPAQSTSSRTTNQCHSIRANGVDSPDGGLEAADTYNVPLL